MVGKFTAIVLAILLFCSFTIAKERNKAHRHDEDTIDIDEPDGYVMDGPASEEGSGPFDDTERGDDEDYASGTGPIIPNSGDGPDIVPVPVTRPPSTRRTTKKPPTHPSLTPCQQLLRNSSPYKESYVPRCTKTGEYERTQCRGNEECWCVNPKGRTIDGTVKQIHMHTDRPDCEGGSNITPCVYLRVQSEWDQLLGAFNPRCTATGDFEKMQCRERECWCVDSFGQVVDNTMALFPDQPNCEGTKMRSTTRTPITEPPIVTRVDKPKYVTPEDRVTEKNNELGQINPGGDDDDDDEGYETKEEETNEVGKQEETKAEAGAVSSPSIMGQPGILAGIIGGAVVGLLCAILLVMFIVYRMRKKDEGSYALDEPTKARGAYAYQKAPDREFYA